MTEETRLFRRTIIRNGYISIPAPIRRELGLETGDPIDVVIRKAAPSVQEQEMIKEIEELS